MVGATHWEAPADESGEALPGPQPEFFFAPDHMRRRSADWGREELDRRVGEAWLPFVEWAAGWLKIKRGKGPDAVQSAYLELLDGRTNPSVGHVLTP